MKEQTKDKLLVAYNYCKDNGKSNVYTIQYMMDFANVDLDCVINFLEKLWKIK